MTLSSPSNLTDNTRVPAPGHVPDGFWAEHLNDTSDEVAWIWRGFLARGSVTLLTSQWKSGKTTLVSILLARLKHGGDLVGMPLVPARAVVISEEGRAQWRLRHRKLDFQHVYFFCRPFAGKPDYAEWVALLDRVVELHLEHGIGLVVIDTLASFLPGRNESSAGVMLDALMPLQRLTELGISVLLLHHPRKGATVAGQASRGSGALPAFVDVIVEMNWCSSNRDTDRRRQLLAFSRYEETPRQVVIELNPAGIDYVTHGDFQADDFLQSWDQLRMVLEDAAAKLDRRQILAQWPPDFTTPADITLWRWLQRAVDLGLVCQEGTGRRADPFRYWLPASEAQWHADPLRELAEEIERSRRFVEEELQKQNRPMGTQ